MHLDSTTIAVCPQIDDYILAIDFDDDFIYKEIALPVYRRQKPSEILLRDEAIKAFQLWQQKVDKTEY